MKISDFRTWILLVRRRSSWGNGWA